MQMYRPCRTRFIERFQCNNHDGLVDHHPTGFMTMDAVAALMTSAMIAVSLLKTLLSLTTGWQVIQSRLEVDQSWANIQRVFTQDGHCAVAQSIVYDNLNLTLATGVSYRYLLNAANQVIRIQQGGGASVVGGLVKSLTVSLHQDLITVTCVFINLTSHSVTIGTLAPFL